MLGNHMRGIVRICPPNLISIGVAVLQKIVCLIKNLEKVQQRWSVSSRDELQRRIKNFNTKMRFSLWNIRFASERWTELIYVYILRLFPCLHEKSSLLLHCSVPCISRATHLSPTLGWRILLHDIPKILTYSVAFPSTNQHIFSHCPVRQHNPSFEILTGQNTLMAHRRQMLTKIDNFRVIVVVTFYVCAALHTTPHRKH